MYYTALQPKENYRNCVTCPYLPYGALLVWHGLVYVGLGNGAIASTHTTVWALSQGRKEVINLDCIGGVLIIPRYDARLFLLSYSPESVNAFDTWVSGQGKNYSDSR